MTLLIMLQASPHTHPPGCTVDKRFRWNSTVSQLGESPLRKLLLSTTPQHLVKVQLRGTSPSVSCERANHKRQMCAASAVSSKNLNPRPVADHDAYDDDADTMMIMRLMVIILITTPKFATTTAAMTTMMEMMMMMMMMMMVTPVNLQCALEPASLETSLILACRPLKHEEGGSRLVLSQKEPEAVLLRGYKARGLYIQGQGSFQ